MNAAWAGQWDMKEIMISMGNHITTDNLKNGGEFTVAFATKKTMVGSDFVGIVSAKNDPKKMEKTGWNIKKATMVNAPVFTDFPMTMECRIKEKYDESETGYYLIAEIVNILVDEKLQPIWYVFLLSAAYSRAYPIGYFIPQFGIRNSA